MRMYTDFTHINVYTCVCGVCVSTHTGDIDGRLLITPDLDQMLSM